MSRTVRSPGLPRAVVVIMTVLWLAPIEIPLFSLSPGPMRPAAAQDFPQEPGGQDPNDPDAMPPPHVEEGGSQEGQAPREGGCKKGRREGQDQEGCDGRDEAGRAGRAQVLAGHRADLRRQLRRLP